MVTAHCCMKHSHYFSVDSTQSFMKKNPSAVAAYVLCTWPDAAGINIFASGFMETSLRAVSPGKAVTASTC